MQSDLFDLQSTFQASMPPSSSGLPAATAWAGNRAATSNHLCFLDLGDVFCMLVFSLLSDWRPPLPLHPFFSVSLSSACVDPFTSAEAGDDSMPNLNPFLSKLVVDATHLPVVSSDGVSFSSRTSAHEMFGGNASLWFFPKKLSSPCSFLC